MTIPFPSARKFGLRPALPICARAWDGLALLVQETPKRDPHCGHLFMFRGRSGGPIKVLWHGQPDEAAALQALGEQVDALAVGVSRTVEPMESFNSQKHRYWFALRLGMGSARCWEGWLTLRKPPVRTAIRVPSPPVPNAGDAAPT